MNNIDLGVEIGGIKFKNPVIPASGTFGIETSKLIDIDKLGAILPKSITYSPRVGNPTPRMAETDSGILNSVGIPSKGIKNFIEKDLRFYSQFNTPIIVSVFAFTLDEFKKNIEILNREKACSMIELNISCPNLGKQGKAFGMRPEDTYRIVKEIKSISDKPIIPKLTPNTNNIVEIARAAKEARADGVSLVNTFWGMAIDVETQRPKLANITGGLSGPAIKPIALRMVWQVYNNVDIPIIGIGGIVTWKDAVEYLLAGATSIQVGTANLSNPNHMIQIIDGIEKYLIRKNHSSVKDIIGKLQIKEEVQ